MVDNADALGGSESKTGAFDLPPRYLWLVALPLTVVLVGDLVLDSASSRFENPRFSVTFSARCTNLQFAQALSEAGGRLWLLISAAALVAVACSAFAFAVWDTFRLLSRPAFYTLCHGLLLAVAAFGFIHVAGYRAGIFLPSIGKLGPGVVATAEACAQQLGGPGFMLMTIDSFVLVISIILVLPTASIVFATIACLAGPTMPHLEVREQVRIWKLQSRRAERFLKIGAGVLVVGLVFHICWTTWPEFLFKDVDTKNKNLVNPDALKSYQSLVSAFTGYKAAQFTIFLAAFYLPAAMILSQRANSIARLHSERRSKGRGQPVFVDAEVREKLGLVQQDRKSVV